MFTLVAQFSCDPPKLQAHYENDKMAGVLFRALPDSILYSVGDEVAKDAQVECRYNLLEHRDPDGGALLGYDDQYICKVNAPRMSQVVLRDVFRNDEVIQKQGALALMNALPVWDTATAADFPATFALKTAHVFATSYGVMSADVAGRIKE